MSDVSHRHWRASNPGRPGDRLVFAALSAFRSTIAAGRFDVHPHARDRMAERHISSEQMLDTVRDGRIIPCATQWTSADHISGGYLAGDLMIIVTGCCPRGVAFRDIRPTVRTLYRTMPFDASQPLTMPLGELAQLKGAMGTAPHTASGCCGCG